MSGPKLRTEQTTLVPGRRALFLWEDACGVLTVTAARIFVRVGSHLDSGLKSVSEWMHGPAAVFDRCRVPLAPQVDCGAGPGGASIFFLRSGHAAALKSAQRQQAGVDGGLGIHRRMLYDKPQQHQLL